MSQSELRAVWDAIPSALKTMAGYVMGFGSAVMLVGAALDIPGRVSATEAVTAQHATDIVELRMADANFERQFREKDRRDEYLICLVEYTVGEGRRTPAQCASDYAVRIVP